MYFVSFFHVVFKISNFNMQTAKHLAQASCAELTLQWKEYETDSLFLILGQNLPTNYLLIYLFCINHEPEIIMLVHQIKTKTISSLQLYQNTQIIKESIVNFLLIWRNYGSVTYSFSCKIIFLSLFPANLYIFLNLVKILRPFEN